MSTIILDAVPVYLGEEHPDTERAIDLRVNLDNGTQGTWASVIGFDAAARIVIETRSKLYSGYCANEIVVSELVRIGIDDDDAQAAADSVLPPCECD